MSTSAGRLSRLVSHALRHEPWLYELELDNEGWVAVSDLVDAIRLQGPEWSQLTTADVAAMIATSPKRRHEMESGRIRALYGHSLPGRVLKTEASPPEQLFHGTSQDAWAVIQQTGLQPMGRQNVHLSSNAFMAEQVGRRKSATPVILVVDAQRAHQGGSRFWQGNDTVWLADFVAPVAIAVVALAG